MKLMPVSPLDYQASPRPDTSACQSAALRVPWRDWYTHAVVNATGQSTTPDAPISHINVHIQDNSALLLYQEPGYTIYEIREGFYSLLVSLNTAGTAFGTAYVDDGISFPPGPSRSLTFQAGLLQKHANNVSNSPRGMLHNVGFVQAH
jgi:alpha-glucosidase (family GH31 glycosyl hydrolase)